MTMHVSTGLEFSSWWNSNSCEWIKRNVAAAFGNEERNRRCLVFWAMWWWDRSSFLQHFLNALNGFSFRFWYAKQCERRIQNTKCREYEEAYVCAKVVINRWVRSAHSESNEPCERRTKCQRHISNLRKGRIRLRCRWHRWNDINLPLAVTDPCWWWMAKRAVLTMQ